MGYESKIYFCRRYNHSYLNKKYHPSEIIAQIDMCKMGYSDAIIKFRNLFNKETDFTLFINDYNDETEREEWMDVIEDRYGDRLCYGDITELRKQMSNVIKESEENGQPYWRFYLLYDMLKSFEKNGGEDIYVVHYGY